MNTSRAGFVPAPNTVQIVLVYRVSLRLEKTTLYAEWQHGAVTLTAMVALATAIRQWYLIRGRAIISNQARLLRVEVRDMSAQNGAYYTLSTESAGVGAHVSAPLPQHCSLIIRWLGESVRVGQQGRTHVPGVPASSWFNGAWLYARQIAIAAAYAALHAVINNANWRHVIVSRWAHGARRSVALLSPVQEIAVREASGSLSRRRGP